MSDSLKVKPIVSVVVVTYNHKDYITKCLEGILMQQTTFSFEVIIGEDESSDGTREICQDYANRYPDKIRLFLRSRKNVIYINGKPTGRFNMIESLKESKGNYIALCEGDDYWTDPLKLQKQVGFLEAHPDYILCFTNTSVVNEYGELIKAKELNGYPDTLNHEDMPLHVPTLTRVFRNKFLKFSEFKNVIGGDTYILLWQSRFGKIKYIDSVTSAYRVHSQGAWSSKSHVGKLQHMILTRISCLKVVKPSLLAKFYRILFGLLLDMAQIEGSNYKPLVVRFMRAYLTKLFSVSLKQHVVYIQLFFLFLIQPSKSSIRTYRIKALITQL